MLNSLQLFREEQKSVRDADVSNRNKSGAGPDISKPSKHSFAYKGKLMMDPTITM